ncbi:MAG TPA: hypothetical protein PKJ23_17260, partial [bacterium]|nr:hypothetical protein [bacterium]
MDSDGLSDPMAAIGHDELRIAIFSALHRSIKVYNLIGMDRYFRAISPGPDRPVQAMPWRVRVYDISIQIESVR